MEVQLEVADGQATPKDTFVSLRIGDVQKQSRLSGSRTLNFPDPGESRRNFGRIEIFKRVGHINVSFGDCACFQAFEVPVDIPGLKTLSMRCAVKTPADVAPSSPMKSKRPKERLDAARLYLIEHRLEELLSECMRQVIQQKPSDPITFLSDIILKHATNSPVKPEVVPLVPESTTEAAPANVAVKPSVGTLYKPLLLKAQPPAEGLGQLREQARDVFIKASEDGILLDTLKSICASEDAEGLDQLREQARNVFIKASQEGSLLDTLKSICASEDAEGSDQLREQARDVFIKASQDGILLDTLKSICESEDAEGFDQLREQASDAFIKASQDGILLDTLKSICASDDAEGLDQLREQARDVFIKAIHEGSLLDTLKSILTSADTTTSTTFVYKPSVGTWLARRSVNAQVWKLPEHPIPDQAPEAPSAPGRPFVHQPSVGSWLSPIPYSPGNPTGGRAHLAVARPFMYQPSVGSWLSPIPFPPGDFLGGGAEPAASLAPTAVPFIYKASVGSWLCPRSLGMKAQGKEQPKGSTGELQVGKTALAGPFFMRPSVGSWLMQLPEVREADGYGSDSRAGLLALPSKDLVMMDTVKLIDAFKAELERKEKEIAELRAKLGN